MATQKFSGNGKSKVFLTDVKGLVVMERGTTLTQAEAKTLVGWQGLINPATSAAIKATYIDLARGFEPKTTAPEFTTANTGYKEKTKDFAPEFTGYAFMSYEDYVTWFAADCAEFDFVPILANGDFLCSLQKSTGKVMGFEGRMFLTFDLPKPGGDGKQKAHAFDIMFDDVEQYKNHVLIKTNFGRRELEESVPIGVNLEVLTGYESTGGTVVIKATHRVSGVPYSGLPLVTQWKVVATTTDPAGAATAIVATSANIGVYTLTFLNGAAKLTGDFEIQAETIVGSNVAYLSNVLNVPI